MSDVVVAGASLTCAAGAFARSLKVTSHSLASINGELTATIMDVIPVVNIPPFGNCKILTSAAQGTPTPCVPAPVGTWQPGALGRTIMNLPVLTLPALPLMCGVGGAITITKAGQQGNTSV